MARAPRVRDFLEVSSDPSPTVLTSEFSRDELAERYLAQLRARTAEIRKAAAGGAGDQADTPQRLPDDESNQGHRRRKPRGR